MPVIVPFGNGAERVRENKNVGGQILGLDFNRHSRAHLLRAAQDGIAFSFRYGVDIMKGMGLDIRVIRAGHANMFLSSVFRQTLAESTDATIELYDADGAQGAARGAAVGAGLYASLQDAFESLERTEQVCPSSSGVEATDEAFDSRLSHQ